MLHLYCDVSLPVPLDQPFTYLLPETLRHRVQTGCRVLVPFGKRTVAGVVLRVHNDPPPTEPREALRLLDEEPVLDEGLLKLGRWIADYYCAPLGETLRAMTPLAADIRHGKRVFAHIGGPRRGSPVSFRRSRGGCGRRACCAFWTRAR